MMSEEERYSRLEDYWWPAVCIIIGMCIVASNLSLFPWKVLGLVIVCIIPAYILAATQHMLPIWQRVRMLLLLIALVGTAYSLFLIEEMLMILRAI